MTQEDDTSPRRPGRMGFMARRMNTAGWWDRAGGAAGSSAAGDADSDVYGYTTRPFGVGRDRYTGNGDDLVRN